MYVKLYNKYLSIFNKHFKSNNVKKKSYITYTSESVVIRGTERKNALG